MKPENCTEYSCSGPRVDTGISAGGTGGGGRCTGVPSASCISNANDGDDSGARLRVALSSPSLCSEQCATSSDASATCDGSTESVARRLGGIVMDRGYRGRLWSVSGQPMTQRPLEWFRSGGRREGWLDCS